MYHIILPIVSTRNILTIELKTSDQDSKDVDIACYYVACKVFEYCIYCCHKLRSIFWSARPINC